MAAHFRYPFSTEHRLAGRSSKKDLLSFLKTGLADQPRSPAAPTQNQNLPKPDFIFCTGDIAYGESRADEKSEPITAQYAAAKVFFTELLAACGSLPVERLFVVPGNHDVNAEAVKAILTEQTELRKNAAKSEDHEQFIRQQLLTQSPLAVKWLLRLKEFRDFTQDFLPHQGIDPRSYFSKLTTLQGRKIAVAGFNSAWSCFHGGVDDDRNVWLSAATQFDAVKEVMGSADLRIGLMHHPQDWLTTSDRNISRARILNGYEF